VVRRLGRGARSRRDRRGGRDVLRSGDRRRGRRGGFGRLLRRLRGRKRGADGDSVVGFASAERTWADEVELHTIYVHPDRWGEGVGAALFEEIESWAQAEGVDRIACGVLADNAVGAGFFEAIGFQRGRKTEAEIAGAIREEYEYELSL